MEIKEIVKIIEKGGIGVMPTDTIYGLVGSALSKKAVARIYKVRKRDHKKPLIILISSIGDLKKFGILLSKRHKELLEKIWSGPARFSRKACATAEALGGTRSAGAVSVILPLPTDRKVAKKFSYLHRGTQTIAFRLPKDSQLQQFLKKTGPLVAPSANIAGRSPAKTVKEAEKYFGGKVDFYIDGGKIAGAPSVILAIKR